MYDLSELRNMLKKKNTSVHNIRKGDHMHIAYKIISGKNKGILTSGDLMCELMSNGLTFEQAAGAIGFAVSHSEIHITYSQAGVKNYTI